MADTLLESVNKGLAELGDPPAMVEVEDEGEKETAPEPGAETGGTPEGEESEEDLTEEQLASAKTIFKALNDPKTSVATLQFLATQMGVDLPREAPETKREATEQAKDIIEQMREAAPGLEFIIDKIGPIIKQNLLDEVAKVRGEVEADRTERANEALKNESTQAMTSIAKEFNYKDNLIPKNVLDTMTSMMAKLQPSPDLKPKEYIGMLHDAARAHLGITKVEKTVTPVNRLASERVSPGRGTNAPEKPTKMNINQAITAAVEKLTSGG